MGEQLIKDLFGEITDSSGELKAKYPNGTRVKVSVGHLIYSFEGGKCSSQDISPHLTEDVATVEYTYGEKSETDYKYSRGERGYSQYCLKFDKYGSIAWFNESVITAV